MEDKLMEVFDRNVYEYPMHMELYYSKNTDWCCKIWKKGDGYDGYDLVITDVQNCDKDYVIAKAYIDLCDHLSKENGEY